MTAENATDDPTDRLPALLAALTLEQKSSLVQGADFWTTTALPEIGLRAMTLSDGPAGRGGTSGTPR